MTKPQFESYRYVGEVSRLQSQSMVECRFAGSEIGSVLAMQVNVAPGECICKDGEVQYAGKAIISLVYEDGDRRICRAERGVEFFHKADGKEITPACFVKPCFTAENINYRREGSGLYLSAVVQADLLVYGSKQMEYLTGGEGIIGKEAKTIAYKNICLSAETEGEDEFDTEYVGDILLHSETAIANHVSANAGQIEIEGELALNICVLKSDDAVCSYERLLPFRMQVPCDEAFGHIKAGARMQVKSAHLTASTDEEKGKCHIVFSYCLSADCHLHIQEEISAVEDAFSLDGEVLLKSAKDGGRYLTNQLKCTERVNGVAALSPAIEGEYTLQAAVLPRAEIVCKKGERSMEAEGAVYADVLLCGADGTHRKAELSLPFVFPIETEGDFAEVDCIVCGLNVRRKKSGETEAEATLKLCVRSYEEREWAYVSEAIEGEKCDKEESAFSVFLPKAGEDLWGLAKRLNCAPEELKKSNPDLTFPLAEGQRIFVYRRIE